MTIKYRLIIIIIIGLLIGSSIFGPFSEAKIVNEDIISTSTDSLVMLSNPDIFIGSSLMVNDNFGYISPTSISNSIPGIGINSGLLSVSGTWCYLDGNLEKQPIKGIPVYLYDYDTDYNHDFLATTLTLDDGSFIFQNIANEDQDEGGTIDVWMTITAINKAAKVSPDIETQSYYTAYMNTYFTDVSDGLFQIHSDWTTIIEFRISNV